MSENEGNQDQGNMDDASLDKGTETQGQEGQDQGQQAAGDQDQGTQVAQTWPDNWRELMAGDDAKLLKRLDRFASPDKVTQSWRAAEQKISSGEYTKGLGENPSDEELAEWRTENGVPTEADGYLENLPEGLVIEDREGYSQVAEAMLEHNIPPAAAHSIVQKYNSYLDGLLAQQTERDREYATQSEDALRAKWGGDYTPNKNAVENFLDAAPSDANGVALRAILEKTRLSDGTLFRDNPAVREWLTDLALKENPYATKMPSGANDAQSARDRLKFIEGLQFKDRKQYRELWPEALRITEFLQSQGNKAV